MEYKDYYKLLELPRAATPDDIKKAYRRLARKYHPDVSKEAGAEMRFKEINEAYEVLKDPEKRSAYDQLGANWQAGQNFRPPPDWNARAGRPGGAGPGGPGGPHGQFRAEDFAGGDDAHSEFFDALFRHFGGQGGSRQSASFDLQGEDQHAKIQIDLEDTYHGAKRQLKLSMPTVDEQGRSSTSERTIEFNIPKGVRAGQNIRLTGQGMPGRGPSSKRGDLYLEVEFRPHPQYRVEQRDVYQDLPITPWEAALGANVAASTPTGKVELTIPPGSKSGRKLRLKGRGIPGSTPGDLYFVLQLALPPADSDADRAAYQQWAQHFSTFNPRG